MQPSLAYMKYPLSLFWVLFLAWGCQSSSTTEEQAPPEANATTAQQSLPEEQTKALSLDQLNVDRAGEDIVLTWRTLAQVEFEYRFNEELQGEIAYPVFSDTLHLMDGEWIQIEGYVIPLEETGSEDFTILSAFPYAQCFFCGNAGPESVIDVQPASSLRRLKTDEKVRFRGRLRLNDTDLDYLNYILEDASLVE